MIEVVGKTIADLSPAASIGSNFKFLGCEGSSSAYATRSVAYNALSSDLKNVFMTSLLPSIQGQIDDTIQGVIATTPFFKLNGAVEQQVSATSRFKNVANFDDAVHFQQGSDRRSTETYAVTLPKDTYRNLTGNATFTATDDARVATKKDVSDAIASFTDSYITPRQILKLDYQTYKDNGVAITPSDKKKKYAYNYGTAGVDESGVFYRYAGIRNGIPANATQAQADGVVYRETGKYVGAPLTESYRNFKFLTVLYVADDTPTTGVMAAHKMCSQTVSTFSVDLARQYRQYKTGYCHTEQSDRFFDDKKDKWFFNGYTEGLHLSTKTSMSFTDTFLPLFLGHTDYVLVAIFGHNQ